MTVIVNPSIESYVTELVPSRSGTLQNVEAAAIRNHVPMIGPYEGQALSVIARIAGVRSVLEVGTATGYSAIWFARLTAERGGRFVGVELDPSRHSEAEENLRLAGLAGTSQVIRGDAVQVLSELAEQFDLVFLDLVRAIEDPTVLGRLYDLCLARLRVGGVLAVDNVLHGGDVLAPTSESARAADALNRRIASDPRVTATFLTIRDGVAIAQKVSD